tara:strand:+ start:1565 stop:2035 length:471 start_codon:yes stop_codon:yes gene_type:complete
MLKMIAPFEMGICVDDLENMIAFYGDVLGFKLISKIDVPADKSNEAGFTSGGYTIVRMQTNYGERIKLVRPMTSANPRTSGKEVLSKKGNVFLTFIVEDLKHTVSRIKDTDAPIRTQDSIMEVRDGVFLSIIDDPEGNHLEFVEYSDITNYRPDLV